MYAIIDPYQNYKVHHNKKSLAGIYLITPTHSRDDWNLTFQASFHQMKCVDYNVWVSVSSPRHFANASPRQCVTSPEQNWVKSSITRVWNRFFNFLLSKKCLFGEVARFLRSDVFLAKWCIGEVTPSRELKRNGPCD